MAAGTRHLAAIMFTDMVGYSALAQADEPTALKVLERHNRILRPLFSRHKGREVKTVGDAFLVEFDSTLDAVECALDVQRALHDYNASSSDEWKIRIRVGIHVGDVVQTDGDILGDAVNIAARIQPLAEPGGISVTQQVYDLVRNKIPTPLERLPPRELKNIRHPVTVYRVVRPWLGEEAAPEGEGPASARHLAVLRLANISPDPSDAYFADGLTEELISVLSQVPSLTVIARSSVAPYKAQPKPVAEIGHDLGVGTVLEGSVRKAGNRLRITLQLVDVSTQRHIWAGSYNREIDDVFAVQSEVAERTAEALRVRLGDSRPGSPSRRGTAVPEAYEWYLRGLAASSETESADYDAAARAFRKATEFDPNYADAYATWANVLVTVSGDRRPMKDTIPEARELAARALQLDPNSSEAHGALGNILFQSDNDWPRAEAEFRRAIDLNPSNVTAHRFLGSLLIALRRFQEAKEVLRQALRLDPGSPHGMAIAMADIYGGDPDAAIRALQQNVAEKPESISRHIYLGFFLANAGRLDEARAEADRPLDATSDETDRFDHALLNALVGRPQEARTWLAELGRRAPSTYFSGTELAMLHSLLGATDTALTLLEQEHAAGERVLWLYYQGAWFDPLRREPRFLALLRRYGLPEDAPLRASAPAPTTAPASDSRYH